MFFINDNSTDSSSTNVSTDYSHFLKLACTIADAESAAVIAASNNSITKEIAYISTRPEPARYIPFLPAPYPASSETPDNKGLTLFPLNTSETIFLAVIHKNPAPLPQTALNALQDLLALTGNIRVPGRQQSIEAIEIFIQNARKLKKRPSFSLIRFSLDHLAFLNHRYGWDVADMILAEITRRTKDLLPPNSFFGSVGGGNFALLTPAGYTAVTTRSLVKSILHLSDRPIKLPNTTVSFSLSLGWSLFPNDGTDANTLLLSAKAALLSAQRKGGGIEERASENTTRTYILFSNMEQDLAIAAEQDALFLKWMPILDMATQKIVAYEALLRWNRPNHGEITPDLFIQYAEDAGLIESLDRWSLENACRTAATWPHKARVCVNISPTWLSTGRLSKLISKILNETGLEPRRLQIEISETRLTGPGDILFREFSRVRALGVRLALDDFGAGFSSLERLCTYPLDQIKLAQSFIKNLDGNERTNEVIRVILSLAISLNITTCVKGVETEYQMATLEAYGCHEAQGYLLGSPT